MAQTQTETQKTTVVETKPQTVDYSPIAIEEQTQESIAAQIAAYMRPYYDKAIAARKEATEANRAEFDVDAASRGMTSSTWLSDAKQRESKAEASDIANLESDFASALGQSTFETYQTYLDRVLNTDMTNASNQLNVDMFNAQVLQAYEEMMYNRNRSSGSGGRSSTEVPNTEADIQSIIDLYFGNTGVGNNPTYGTSKPNGASPTGGKNKPFAPISVRD